jgi:prepilin-type processing-associated H-X9-DG protein
MAARGITRAEAAAVLACVVLFAAVLGPAVGRTREASEAARCQANLKAIGIALYSYAYKNADLMPGGETYTLPDWKMGQNPVLLGWCESLVIDGDVLQETNRDGKLNPMGSRHYPASGYGIFECPRMGGNMPINKTYGLAWCAASRFGFNTVQGGRRQPSMHTKVSVHRAKLDPNHIIAADGYLQMATSSAWSAPVRGNMPYGVFERHRDGRDNTWGANYLFADGHVEWSDTYGLIPSPMYFGAKSRDGADEDSIWAHP